jgi:hypothetical protein
VIVDINGIGSIAVDLALPDHRVAAFFDFNASESVSEDVAVLDRAMATLPDQNTA